MELEIKSYVGVGPIELGMSRDQVMHSVGKQPKQFFKGPKSVIATDNFGDLGFHVYYKNVSGEVCNAVEMFSPADPSFEGHRFINRSVNEILSWLKNLDPAVKIGDSGLTSYELGFGVYVPNISEAFNALVEAVIVFERDYYKK